MARRSLAARILRRLVPRRGVPPATPPATRDAPNAATVAPEPAPVVDLEPVHRLGDALWAGLATVARPALEARLTPVTEPAEVVTAAAHHLGAWAVMNGEVDLAEAVADHLDTSAVDQAVVAAHIARLRGDEAGARAVLAEATSRYPDDAHVRLHLADLGSLADRLTSIDTLLVAAGCDPLRITRPVATFADLPVLPTYRSPLEAVDAALNPLVTVIVPAYRAAATIAHALASLQAQTYPHLQIIVVEDAGGDETAEIVRQLARDDVRLSLVRQPVNRGAYAARNAGLERATGAFVTVHDADDWAHPQRIDRQVRHLLAHPDLVANATHLVRVDEHLHFQPHGRHPYKLVGKNTASLMVRREIFSVVGPWDAGVRGGADFEFVKRLEARFGAPAIGHLLRRAPLTLSLRHETSLTSSATTGMRSLWHLYGARRQYLDAFTAWHRSERFPRDLPWHPDAPRPFPAPLALTGGTASSFVDVVVRGDLSAGASGVSDAVTQVVRAAGAGRSLALWHEPPGLDDLDAGLDLAIMRLLADRRARLLSAGEQVRCQNLITVGRPSALGVVEGAPEVTVVPW